MFTEGEIDLIIQHPPVLELTEALKKDFSKKEAPYLDISAHDFLSLVILTPSVGKVKANGTMSFGEEMSLQRKARKLSKGGFFLSKDPVVYALKYLIKHYEDWEEPLLHYLRQVFDLLIDKEAVEKVNDPNLSYTEAIMRAPYLFVRFMSSWFFERDEDIYDPGKIRASELDKIKHIMEHLDILSWPLCQELLKRYELKKG